MVPTGGAGVTWCGVAWGRYDHRTGRPWEGSSPRLKSLSSLNPTRTVFEFRDGTHKDGTVRVPSHESPGGPGKTSVDNFRGAVSESISPSLLSLSWDSDPTPHPPERRYRVGRFFVSKGRPTRLRRIHRPGVPVRYFPHPWESPRPVGVGVWRE